MANVSLINFRNKQQPQGQSSRPISPSTVGGTPVHFPSFPGGGGDSSGVDMAAKIAIGIAKLLEAKQNNEILRQKQMEEIRKLHTEDMVKADARTKAMFDKDVEARYGVTPDAETEPYINRARGLTERGATVTGIPGDQGSPKGTPGLTRKIFEEGGNVIKRPASIEDARAALDEGVQDYREESIAGAKRLPPSASGEYVEEEAKTAKVPIRPGGGRLLALGKQASEARTAGATATEAETKARIAAQTEGEAIRGIKADTRTKEATATKTETDALWEPILKERDANLKALDIQLKSEDLKKKPLEYQKAQEEINKLKNDNATAQREYERQGALERLRGNYFDAKTPQEAANVLKQIAVVNGHEGAVISDDRQMQTNYIQGIEGAQKMLATAYAHIKDKNYDAATQALDAYNKIQLQTGQMVGSKTVSIVLPKQTEGMIYGTSYETKPWTGRRDVAESYLNGEVAQALRGEIPGVSPGYALAIKVAMENPGDRKAMEEAIAVSNLSPEDRQIALIQLNALTIKSKEQPKVEGQSKTSSIPDANRELREQKRAELKVKGQEHQFREEVAPSIPFSGLRAARPKLTDKTQIDEYVKQRLGGATEADAFAIATGKKKIAPNEDE